MVKQAAAGTTVGIVGLGYVGLPLAVAFTEAGVDVRERLSPCSAWTAKA